LARQSSPGKSSADDFAEALTVSADFASACGAWAADAGEGKASAPAKTAATLRVFL
jgi:hypothetical protein